MEEKIQERAVLVGLNADCFTQEQTATEESLEELEACAAGDPPDEQLSVSELTAQINAFLAALERDDRVMFVRRYWFAEPLAEIAEAFGISENNAAVRLRRIREKLRKNLEQEAENSI